MPTSGLPSRLASRRVGAYSRARSASTSSAPSTSSMIVEIFSVSDGVRLHQDLVDGLGRAVGVGPHQVGEDAGRRAVPRCTGSGGRKPPVRTRPMTRGTGARARFASIAARTRSSRSPGVMSSVRSRRSSTACVACIAPMATQPIVWPGVASPGEQLAVEVRGDQLERRVGEELRSTGCRPSSSTPCCAEAALEDLRQVADATRRRPC